MAEAVRKVLEDQVAELEDLRRRRIFTAEEIRKIVRKRKAFEYALHRRTPLKRDFLQYIDYELNVELLRKQRKKQLGLRMKNTPSEFAIIRRLHFTFNRALQKFKGDMSLWLQYFDFCEKTRSSKMLGRAFIMAIQFHPRNSDLWIRAAKWEFESNANINAARVLLQRALRLNPQDQTLWREYFRLELLYLEKIKKRREILGIKETTAVNLRDAAAAARAERDGSSDDDDDDADALIGDADEGLVRVPQLAEEQDTKPVAEGDAFLRGDIPRAVFRAAAASFPNDVAFLLSFADIYRLFPDTAAAIDDVYMSLPRCEQSLAAHALRILADEDEDAPLEEHTQRVAEVNKLFAAAVQDMPTAAMFDEYVKFLQQEIAGTLSSLPEAQQLLARLVEVCRDAHEHRAASQAAYSAWINALLTTDAVAAALEAAEHATSAHPGAVCLWLRRLELLFVHNCTWAVIEQIAKKALKNLSSEDQALVRRELLRIGTVLADDEDLEGTYLAAINAGVDVAADYVDWSLLAGGLPAARAAVHKVLSAARSPSVTFFHHCIALERQQGTRDPRPIRTLFERAVGSFGAADTNLWLAYCAFEAEHGSPASVTALYWRATRTLSEPLAFQSAYALQQAGAATPSS